MYIGIDLGGTNIAGGVVDENGKILKKLSVPTRAERSFEEIVKDMADLCKKLMSGSEPDCFKSIGIGSPGAIDSKNGIILNAGNLVWKNVNLKAELKKYLDLPINIENDANACLLYTSPSPRDS